MPEDSQDQRSSTRSYHVFEPAGVVDLAPIDLDAASIYVLHGVVDAHTPDEACWKVVEAAERDSDLHARALSEQPPKLVAIASRYATASLAEYPLTRVITRGRA